MRAPVLVVRHPRATNQKHRDGWNDAERWSMRQTVAFIITSCGLFWILTRIAGMVTGTIVWLLALAAFIVWTGYRSRR